MTLQKAEHYVRTQFHRPYIIDVETYDKLPVYGKRTVDRFLLHNGIAPETVFLIELVPGSAKVWVYDRDQNDNLIVTENDELAYSVQVVYDKRIGKAVYYDLDGNTHESLVYEL